MGSTNPTGDTQHQEKIRFPCKCFWKPISNKEQSRAGELIRNGIFLRNALYYAAYEYYPIYKYKTQLFKEGGAKFHIRNRNEYGKTMHGRFVINI